MRYFFNTFQGCSVQVALIRILCAVTLGTLAGCGSLPSSGPSISMIQSGAESKSPVDNYVLVPVTQDVLDKMQRGEAETSDGFGGSAAVLGTEAGNSSTPNTGVEQLGNAGVQKIATGDVLGVSIYTSGGGLFSSTAPPSTGTVPATSSENTETALPPQLVDSSGEITVPYAGRIPVVGRTPNEVENEINEALKGKAIMPTVIVTIQDQKGSDVVTLSGDVKTPSRVYVPVTGLRIVDAIASAGGLTGKDYETNVTVLRGQSIRTDNYRDITLNPKKNIYLQPGDTVLVEFKPWTYTTMGATGQSMHPFADKQVTAQEALASVNGLDDDKANPEAVFIYRFESPELLTRLGQQHGSVTAAGAPVIYQLNLRDPGGFFMAKQFAMRDKDVIFVGNAGTDGVLKVMKIIGAVTAPAVSGFSDAYGIHAITQ